jgi:hypothetical protein
MIDFLPSLVYQFEVKLFIYFSLEGATMRIRAIFLLFAITFICTNAYATSINYRLSGVITGGYQGLSSFDMGDSWSANLSATDMTGDLYNTNRNFGRYQVNWNGQIQINTTEINLNTANPSNNLITTTLNNLFVPELVLQSQASQLLIIDDYQYNGFAFSLMNSTTASLVDDTFLGTLSYQMNQQSSPSWVTFFLSNGRTLEGSITSVDISPVPEPATIFLLGAGLATLLISRLRKQR